MSIAAFVQNSSGAGLLVKNSANLSALLERLGELDDKPAQQDAADALALILALFKAPAVAAIASAAQLQGSPKQAAIAALAGAFGRQAADDDDAGRSALSRIFPDLHAALPPRQEDGGNGAEADEQADPEAAANEAAAARAQARAEALRQRKARATEQRELLELEELVAKQETRKRQQPAKLLKQLRSGSLFNGITNGKECLLAMLRARSANGMVTTLHAYTLAAAKLARFFRRDADGAFRKLDFDKIFETVHGIFEKSDLMDATELVISIWKEVVEDFESQHVAELDDANSEATTDVARAHHNVISLENLRRLILDKHLHIGETPVNVLCDAFESVMEKCSNSPFSYVDPLKFFNDDMEIDAKLRKARSATAAQVTFSAMLPDLTAQLRSQLKRSPSPQPRDEASKRRKPATAPTSPLS
jgi:hypothetical protein